MAAVSPIVQDISLTDFLNKFRSYRELDPVDNQPEPDMIAARYALTGLSQDSRFVAGINTFRDKLGPRGTLPFVRRDFDSVIGFSADIPISKDVTYYPNPTLTRTLKKTLHVNYFYPEGDEVCRLHSQYVVIKLSDNSYSFASIVL
jgi:hypothetical protein